MDIKAKAELAYQVKLGSSAGIIKGLGRECIGLVLRCNSVNETPELDWWLSAYDEDGKFDDFNLTEDALADATFYRLVEF